MSVHTSNAFVLIDDVARSTVNSSLFRVPGSLHLQGLYGSVDQGIGKEFADQYLSWFGYEPLGDVERPVILGRRFLRVTKVNMAGVSHAGSFVYRTHFHACNLRDSDWSDSRFMLSSFKKCDLRGVNLSRSAFYRCIFGPDTKYCACTVLPDIEEASRTSYFPARFNLTRAAFTPCRRCKAKVTGNPFLGPVSDVASLASEAMKVTIPGRADAATVIEALRLLDLAALFLGVDLKIRRTEVSISGGDVSTDITFWSSSLGA